MIFPMDYKVDDLVMVREYRRNAYGRVVSVDADGAVVIEVGTLTDQEAAGCGTELACCVSPLRHDVHVLAPMWPGPYMRKATGRKS